MMQIKEIFFSSNNAKIEQLTIITDRKLGRTDATFSFPRFLKFGGTYSETNFQGIRLAFFL